MSERKHRRFQHLAWLTVHLCVVLVVAAGASERSRAADISGQRQAVVKERGAAVMPFDLDLTTHTFDDTPDGGIQTVTANDPHDSRQIALIREHLEMLATQFRKGNFGVPAQIHGEEMPGLSTLKANASRLSVSYRTVHAGASLTFSSSSRETVEAVHQWFAAQRSDHAAHGHAMHQPHLE